MRYIRVKPAEARDKYYEIGEWGIAIAMLNL
jgi:hypothetical protein